MRVAVLSDIHANLVALEAVLASIGSVDEIWHLGDVVGYGPEPDGVVERLSGLGAIGVAGNHDLAAAGGDQIDWFNPDARSAMEWTRARISGPTREWLGRLPAHHRSEAFSLVHVYPDTVTHSVVPIDSGPTVGEAVTAQQARARLEQAGIVIPDAPQVPRHVDPAVSAARAGH